MAARGGRNNIVARRVIDDLIDISGERSPLKYLKIFIEQQITDHRRFIARMRDEIRTSTNLISQLNALIAELEASGDYEEVFDLVMELRDDRRDKQDKVADFNRLIVVAEEKIHGKYIDLGMLEAEGNDVAVGCAIGCSELIDGMGMGVKSAAAKMACSKSVYQHTMGRGGYALVKEKMIEKKEIKPDEEPARGTLWLKGRVNKDGEYPDDEIRSVGDKLKETEDKIKEGTLKVDHGTDAMTIVLGKEKGGYARGVGSGVTYKRYFDLPRSRQASDERILLLQSQLDNERRERQEKELLIQNLSNKMSQIEGMVTKLKNQLAVKGGQFQSILTRLTPPNVSPVDINPINSNADEEGGTTVVRFKNDASIQKSNGLATL
ncbi:reverse transcriptase domain-containing protein [Tanacetum coccineum]